MAQFKINYGMLKETITEIPFTIKHLVPFFAIVYRISQLQIGPFQLHGTFNSGGGVGVDDSWRTQFTGGVPYFPLE
jgi:hypothetical protein